MYLLFLFLAIPAAWSMIRQSYESTAAFEEENMTANTATADSERTTEKLERGAKKYNSSSGKYTLVLLRKDLEQTAKIKHFLRELAPFSCERV